MVSGSELSHCVIPTNSGATGPVGVDGVSPLVEAATAGASAAVVSTVAGGAGSMVSWMMKMRATIAAMAPPRATQRRVPVIPLPLVVHASLRVCPAHRYTQRSPARVLSCPRWSSGEARADFAFHDSARKAALSSDATGPESLPGTGPPATVVGMAKTRIDRLLVARGDSAHSGEGTSPADGRPGARERQAHRQGGGHGPRGRTGAAEGPAPLRWAEGASSWPTRCVPSTSPSRGCRPWTWAPRRAASRTASCRPARDTSTPLTWATASWT